jgi:predicted permease
MAALFVGITTAWRTSRVPPLRVLAGSGAGTGLTARGGKTRTVLVAIQITAAVVVVMAAGLAVERFQQDRARSGPPARARYDERLLAGARVDLDLLKYNESRGRAFFDQLVAKARTLPGVEGAAITGSLWGGGLTNLETEPPPTGRVGAPTLTRVYTTRVSAGYLQTLGLPLTRGRDFTRFDTDGAPKVALISESAVEHLWPHGDDPIGKRVKFGPWDWLTVVGVTADAVSSADRGPTRPSNTMYIPFAQWYQASALIVVRSPSPAAVLEPLRLAVNEINPDVAVFDATTGDGYVRRNHGVDLAFGALITSLGAVALAVAMLGVYGVVAFFVSTRRREFGIRLALGATPGRVIKLVVDHAIHLVLVGLLPGVLIVSVGARFTQSQVSAFTPMNIATWFVVPALIVVAGALAGYVPARRAASVDPNVALRDL